MKIIDLLDKIANGEELPKHIKYCSVDYFLEPNTEDYKNTIGFSLFRHDDNYDLLHMFNDEVKILEEKKIPEKIGSILYCEDPATSIIHHKVDEIIDYLQYVKSKGDE